MADQRPERRRKRPVSAVMLRPEYARLGEWLRSQREASGLSQREVSRRLGMPVSYVNKVELGQRRLDLVEFLDMADTIALDPNVTIEAIKAASQGDTSL